MLSIFLTLYTSAERNSMSLPPTATGGAWAITVSLGFEVAVLCPFTIEEERLANNMMKAHLFMARRISYRLI